MWTDQQELELERQQRSRLIQKVNDIKATIEQHTDRKATIGNIGITYNNRMVEFYQNCARCNISYIQSSLRRVISSYLMDVVINAINELQDYINCFDIKIDETNVQEEASKILSQANPKLQEYEKLSDEVFSFDINKDIVKACLFLTAEYCIDRIFRRISYIDDQIGSQKKGETLYKHIFYIPRPPCSNSRFKVFHCCGVQNDTQKQRNQKCK